jgi:tetratricopeptide (TPR) repeat protein
MNMDSQVESGLRTAVFLSATSSDLGECRRRTSEILMEAGVFPVVQDYFGPDPRTLEDLLLDKILAADAVVCLVGHVFGAAPTTPERSAHRSYTQIEYDLALRYEKQLYIFVATDEFAQAYPHGEPEAFRAIQEAHRKAILTGPRKYQLFSSLGELEGHIHALVRPILARPGRRSIKYVHIPPAPLCFVGRTDEAAQLNAAIDNRLAAIVVLGMGGQGKTTLLAHTLRQRTTLPFAAGVWVSAERGGFTFTEFLDCALTAFMGNRFNKADLPRLDARIRQLISLLQTRPLLIVIDAIERWLTGWVENRNIDGLHDLSLRQGAAEGLDEFLKEVSALENGSHLIVTSRALPAALDNVDCTILPVFPKDNPEIGLRALSPDAAVELLERLGMVAPREKLRELARSLVYHPLALTGFARVAKRVGANWETLLSGRGTDPSRVFHGLVDEVRKHLPNRDQSESLLKYASLLPEGAPLGILNWLLRGETVDGAARDPDLLSQVVALADWNLLIWDSQECSVRLHALVAEYFSELIPESEKCSIHCRAASWYEDQARIAGATAARGNYGVLALRHAITARKPDQALKIMFSGSQSTPSLFDWLTFNGHLWECAELLASVQEIGIGLNKVQCILARAQILNELELSHRALADIQQATSLILSQREPGFLPLQLALARCYGLQGLIHSETGRATDALPFLDKAVGLFESLAQRTMDSQLDLAKTLANRGLGKWNCGDLDGATADYERALELLRRSEGNPPIDSLLMAHEIRSRIAALNIDRGDPASAVRGLEDAVRELRRALENSQGRPSKNFMAALLALAAAHIAAGNPESALPVVREVVLPLEEMARQGRWEFNSTLAQARVNEAQALLRLGRVEEGFNVSERAVRLYEELVEKGAVQFQGQLSNALFRRAEASIRLDRKNEGSEDLRRAFSISQEWLRAWFGECNFQNVFINNALQSLSYLSKGFDPEKRTVLEILRYCLERLLSAPPQYAATIRAKSALKAKWPALKVVAAEVKVDWPPEFPAG